MSCRPQKLRQKVGSKAIDASKEISDSEEYYLGRGVAARILSQYPLSKDQALNTYVNEVGQTVAKKSTRPRTYKGYHFAVLESSTPNSFACPGGIIFITKGMIKNCCNEDQLAAVLAHEVGHVANRDGISSIKQARWTEVATTAGTEAAKKYGGSIGQLVARFEGSIDDVFKTVIVNGYSRAAEENADRAGVEMMKRAGYNPAAMMAILTYGFPGRFRRDFRHPSGRERIGWKISRLLPSRKIPRWNRSGPRGFKLRRLISGWPSSAWQNIWFPSLTWEPV